MGTVHKFPHRLAAPASASRSSMSPATDWHPLDSANREDPFVPWLDPKSLERVFDDRPDLTECLRGPEPQRDWIPILLGALVGLWVVAFIAGSVM